MKPLSNALNTIDAALKVVAHWNPDEPDEKKRGAIPAAMHAGFRAAYDLTAPEGTTSPSAKQRRERLTAQRYLTMFSGLATKNEPLGDDWVAVARAAAWLGRLVIMITREDFSASKKRHKTARVMGKLSGGDDLGQTQEKWLKHAKKRAAKTPGMTASALAAEIAGNEKLNPRGKATDRHPDGKQKAVGTINNYLSKNRTEWDPERR